MTHSPATGGYCSVSRDEKEHIMTLIPWQNKELHQGQCHTVSEGRSAHTQLSGSLVHTQQLLKDCTDIPAKLAPTMSPSPPRQRKRKSPRDWIF